MELPSDVLLLFCYVLGLALTSSYAADGGPREFVMDGVTYTELPLPCGSGSRYCPLDICSVTTLTTPSGDHCLLCRCLGNTALSNLLQPVLTRHNLPFYELPSPCSDNSILCPVGNCSVTLVARAQGQGNCLVCSCPNQPRPTSRRRRDNSTPRTFTLNGLIFSELPLPCSPTDHFCNLDGCAVHTLDRAGAKCLQCSCAQDPLPGVRPVASLAGADYYALPKPCRFEAGLCVLKTCKAIARNKPNGAFCLDCSCSLGEDHCDVPPAVSGAQAIYSTTDVNATVSYTCRAPYFSPDGMTSDTITCLDGNFWETPTLICVLGPDGTQAPTTYKTPHLVPTTQAPVTVPPTQAPVTLPPTQAPVTLPPTQAPVTLPPTTTRAPTLPPITTTAKPLLQCSVCRGFPCTEILHVCPNSDDVCHISVTDTQEGTRTVDKGCSTKSACQTKAHNEANCENIEWVHFENRACTSCCDTPNCNGNDRLRPDNPLV